MNQQHEYAGTILRTALGMMYLAHGLTKLFIFTPAGTAGFFSSLGLPGFLGPMTMGLEIIGGVALITGLYARWVAVALIPVLLGAILFVHGSNGWSFSNEGGGWEFPAFLIVASISQFFLGDGAFSIRHPFQSKLA
ncbi:DoxX family protein [Oleiphilus messinensis]|uniref:DoxX family protein n=1 Tax=Oleiphilus messinensis TaxID=141451 RepID=A0A1Y0I1J3_9GAMM|nr:DoxX family protein [Oleiphilus messinensis]ARU54327.1 DoxX family protein [Oleiphilus messinensis]